MRKWQFWKKREPRDFLSVLESEGFGYLASIDGWSSDVKLHIGRYVRAIEIGISDELCKCDWIIHPDDLDKPKGKRRKRRSTPHFDCPVHTREGFLFGFLEWMKTHAAR